MSKTIITLLLPLLGPFIGYFLWQQFVGRLLRGKNKQRLDDEADSESADTDDNNRIKANHMAWCLLIGVLFAVISVLVFGINTEKKDIGTYTPPIYEDGEIKPGRFKSE